MNRNIKTLLVLTLAVGAFLLLGAWMSALPRDTYIDGLCVGGLSRRAAVAALREKKTEELMGKELIIYADEYAYKFTYPEFNFRDDYPEVVNSVRRGGRYASHAEVYLNGAQLVADALSSRLERALVEPYAQFNLSGEAFSYFEGSDGVRLDRAALLDDISRSLNGSFCAVRAKTVVQRRKKSLEGVKRETSLLCSFSTRFDSSNRPRSSNIALACSKINGLVLGGGEAFSFNCSVGPRTAANGFRAAKIISGGKFIDGIGGGVCQVSTTLYNAAVLSGMDITEFHPHSLKVSYVSPSRDAMVSGNYFDLRFKNTRKTPVYIRANTSDGVVNCSLYGESDGVSRTFVSRTLEVIPQPEDVVGEGAENIISRGCDGAVSEGYLVEERGGVRTQKLIRKDSYAAMPTVRTRPADALSGEGQEPASPGAFFPLPEREARVKGQFFGRLHLMFVKAAPRARARRGYFIPATFLSGERAAQTSRREKYGGGWARAFCPIDFHRGEMLKNF